jgi:hypothetical protein
VRNGRGHRRNCRGPPGLMGAQRAPGLRSHGREGRRGSRCGMACPARIAGVAGSRRCRGRGRRGFALAGMASTNPPYWGRRAFRSEMGGRRLRGGKRGSLNARRRDGPDDPRISRWDNAEDVARCSRRQAAARGRSVVALDKEALASSPDIGQIGFLCSVATNSSALPLRPTGTGGAPGFRRTN